jgi:hypothetical protein
VEDQAFDWSQGTVFPDVFALPSIGSDGTVQGTPTTHGVVAITQTCDAARSEYLQVCRIERGLSRAEADNAAKGKITRFVPLPNLGDNAFADLSTIATVSREWLTDKRFVRGVTKTVEQRQLRQGIGRRFSRVPLPDEVTEWLRPFQEKAKRQAGHPRRELHWAFGRIQQIRIASSSGWAGPTYSLAITFIMNDEVLPQFTGEDMPDCPETLRRWIVGKTLTQLESRLRELSDEEGRPLQGERLTDKIHRYYLWAALGETLLGLCRNPGGGTQHILDAECHFASADEFTLRDLWDSEQLDLDHLSDASPQCT